MSEPKQVDDALSFMSPRLREILRRLASIDRRSEMQELAWLIDARAHGQLRYSEDREATPLIPLNDLPFPTIERATVQRKGGPVLEKGYKQPPEIWDAPPNGLQSKI